MRFRNSKLLLDLGSYLKLRKSPVITDRAFLLIFVSDQYFATTGAAAKLK